MNHGTDSLEYCRKDWVSEYSFLVVVFLFHPAYLLHNRPRLSSIWCPIVMVGNVQNLVDV